jgi:hypothetical protein
MVSAQLIILTIAIVGFFATGGLSKLTTAKDIIKTDFAFAKMKTTDFVNDIKTKSKSGMKGAEG